MPCQRVIVYALPFNGENYQKKMSFSVYIIDGLQNMLLLKFPKKLLKLSFYAIYNVSFASSEFE